MGWVVCHDRHAVCLFWRCAQLEGSMEFIDCPWKTERQEVATFRRSCHFGERSWVRAEQLRKQRIEGGLPRRCHPFTSEETYVAEQQSLWGIRNKEVASVKLLCQRNGSDFPFGANA